MKTIICFLSSFLLLSQLHAEGEATPPPSDFASYQGLIMILIFVLFMYFILWRPEQKRRKALEQQRSSMKKGDKVTAVGIVGTIDKIEQDTVILKMVDGGKIEVLKAAITDVIASSDTPSS